MFERFTRTARVAVEDARYEAERRGDRRIGSDHLLTALLRDERLAQQFGIDADTITGTADRLDREAISAVGFEPSSFPAAQRITLGRSSVPMTSGAKEVLRGALSAASGERAREITARHLLLAVLERRAPDPAAEILDALAIDRVAARDRLADVSG